MNAPAPMPDTIWCVLRHETDPPRVCVSSVHRTKEAARNAAAAMLEDCPVTLSIDFAFWEDEP